MPAFHLVEPGYRGITLINIGTGPSNARNVTDHVAVLRPHAWLMVGHCAGLRNTQRLGDYVLAHGYVREDHVLDHELPLWVPIPALAEMQVALEEAVGEVTGLTGFELKRVMRTGTVASVDNRNWEISDPVGHSTAVAIPRCRARHGVGGDRRQRLSLPRPLRHLAVRLRQAAARRNQARRHGQRILPATRRPASRDRPEGAGTAQAPGIASACIRASSEALPKSHFSSPHVVPGTTACLRSPAGAMHVFRGDSFEIPPQAANGLLRYRSQGWEGLGCSRHRVPRYSGPSSAKVFSFPAMQATMARGRPFAAGGSARWCNSVTLVAALQRRRRTLDAERAH